METITFPAVLNYDRAYCVARKSDGSKCTNRVSHIDEEYCGVHRKQKKISRIDEVLVIRRRVKKQVEMPATACMSATPCMPATSASLLQACIWRAFVQRANRLRGKGAYHRDQCTNREDMFLFDDLTDIHPVDFYSVTDTAGFTYGFHIDTMYQYISKTIGITSPTATSSFRTDLFINPYTKVVFGRKVYNDFKRLYAYYRLLTKERAIVKDPPVVMTPQQKVYHTVCRVFQKMDELNNYTNTDWFMELNRTKLIKFVLELRELFEYRMDLPFARRLQIVSTGRILTLPFTRYNAMNDSDLRLYILGECEKLVSEGHTKDDRYLGSLVILTALTELVPKCAEAYPWLLQATFER